MNGYGKRQGMRVLLPLLTVVTVIVVWHFAVKLGEIPPFLVPSPDSVLEAGIKFAPAFWAATKVTLLETVLGFSLAIVIGLGIAMVFAWALPVKDSVYPLILITQAMPKIAVAPLFIVWLGPTALSAKVLLVFLISFFPIVVNAVRGLESAEPELIDLMRSMGASRWMIFRKLQLPGAVPYIFSGLKVGVTMAVTGALVGELIGGNQGLGYLMNVASGNIDTALMFADIVVLTFMAMVLFYIVEGVDRLCTRWQDRGTTVVNGTM
ncbi:MAG: ABC transporter permease [Lautropia sp.]